MKVSPFALAVVAVAIGLFLSRTREKFEQFEQNCPDGSKPKFREGIPFYCPGDNTATPTCPESHPIKDGDGCRSESGNSFTSGSCPNGFITEYVGRTGTCKSYTPLKCAEGSALYFTLKPSFEPDKALCIPTSTQVYPPRPEDIAEAEKTRPPDMTKICKPGDIFGRAITPSGISGCIPASAAPPPQDDSSVQPHTNTQGRTAGFPSTAAVAKGLQEINQSLKPFRPPTAPSSDLEKERKAILSVTQKDMFFIQVALFLVVVSMLGYIVLPTDYAHGIALLLLTVAISLGFFLRK